MKLSSSIVLTLFAIAGIASGSYIMPRNCDGVKWASGYPIKTVQDNVDSVDCSSAFQFAHSVNWERTVTLDAKIGVSLPDVLGANLEVSRTITNTRGSASSYTCRKTVSKFECIVVKYQEITLEGEMIMYKKRRFAQPNRRGLGVRCVRENGWVKATSVRSAYIDCDPRDSL